MSRRFHRTHSVSVLAAQRAHARRRRYEHSTSVVRIHRLRLLARFLHAVKGVFEQQMTGPCAEDRESKLGLIRYALIAAALLIMGRMASMQTGENNRWEVLASRQHQTSIKIDGARGSILDRSGRPIALSMETFTLGIHPQRLKNGTADEVSIANVLGLERNAVHELLERGGKYARLAKDVSQDQIAQLEKEGVKGLEVETSFRRHYPQGDLGRILVGSVGADGHGQSGVELKFDDELNAKSHVLKVRRDALGRLLPEGSSPESMLELAANQWRDLVPESFAPQVAYAKERDTAPMFRDEGGALELSIDSVVQQILEEELDLGRETAHAKRTFGLVLDAQTGEILAMGQSLASEAGKSKDQRYSSSESLRNVVLQDAFEPGSTFKPVVAALALDRRVVQPNELINCENGNYRVGPNVVRDVHPVGIVPFTEVLVRSSNVGMTKVGSRLGQVLLHDLLAGFGFGQQSGVELAGEGRGILRPVSRWRPIDLATHSFGQGVSVTAIQLTRAYGALANGGMLIEPTILKRTGPAKGVRVLREEVANTVAKALVGVVEGEHGTGKEAAISGLAVSGKTGTAQKARSTGRGYDPDKILASFIGFVDGAQLGVNKRLVMFVAVDEPGVKPRWGGVVAAPVFRRTMERVLAQFLHTEAGRPTHS